MALKCVLASREGDSLASPTLVFHAVDDDGTVVDKFAASGPDPEPIRKRALEWFSALQPDTPRWAEEIDKRIGQEIDLTQPLV